MRFSLLIGPTALCQGVIEESESPDSGQRSAAGGIELVVHTGGWREGPHRELLLVHIWEQLPALRFQFYPSTKKNL